MESGEFKLFTSTCAASDGEKLNCRSTSVTGSMLTQILKCKIHRVTVTEADVDYEGSIALDGEFMEKSGLIPYEMVHIWDITSGDRLYTYVLPPAPKGSGKVAINGAAALRIRKGHKVIITSFVNLTDEQIKKHKPTVLIMDDNNKIKAINHE